MWILGEGGGGSEAGGYFDDHLARGDVLVFEVARVAL